MKFQTLIPVMAAVLGLSSMASHADTLLLSDDFTAPVNNNGPADAAAAVTRMNINLNDRQSGLYSPSGALYEGTDSTSWRLAGSGGFNVQTGNTNTTYAPGPAATDGNNLLLYKTGVQNNLPINFDLAGDHALTISFDMYLSGWESFSLSNTLSNGSDQVAYPLSATTLFSFFANQTTISALNGGTTTPYVNNKTYTASYTSSSWTIVLSDVASGTGTEAVAGTGSPFGGNGTYAAIYYGNTLIDGRALTTEFGDSTLYLGFYGQPGSGAVAFDNLSITAVPEPASVGYIVAAGLGFVILAARRRAVRG